MTALQVSVEESEAIHPEHILHLSQVEPEAQLEIAPSKEEGLPSSPEVDEMAPPRITRAVPPPPPPPQASFEATILQRQSVSLIPEEVSPVSQEPVTVDDENDIHASREGTHDQVGVAPLDPLPSVNTLPREAVVRASSSSTMSRRSIPSSPPITPIASSPVVSTEFRSPVSPSSRKSLPPPQRKASTPSDDSHSMKDSSPSLRSTSPRRAVPAPVRPPVPQTIRSSSPDAPSSPSEKPRPNSVRRSIPPPPSSIPSQATEAVMAPPYPRRMSSQRVEEVIPSTIRRGSSNDVTEHSDALPLARAVAPGIQAIHRESFEEQEVLAESEPGQFLQHKVQCLLLNFGQIPSIQPFTVHHGPQQFVNNIRFRLLPALEKHPKKMRQMILSKHGDELSPRGWLNLEELDSERLLLFLTNPQHHCPNHRLRTKPSLTVEDENWILMIVPNKLRWDRRSQIPKKLNEQGDKPSQRD